MVNEARLRSFKEVVKDIAEEYHVPFETVEAILLYWTKLLYDGMNEVSPKDISLFDSEG